MITPNLGLESIELTDNMQTSLLQKMNSNFSKIDEAYKTLVDGLMVKTGKENLQEALEYYDEMVEKIADYEERVLPKINIILDGTYSGYISGYGAGINQQGELIIWAMSNNASHENIRFNPLSVTIGTQGAGWLVQNTVSDYQGPVDQPQACILSEIDLNLKTINVELNASVENTSYDYIYVDVTVTTE